MTFKRIVLVLAIFGIGFVLAGFVIQSQDSGSCPAGSGGCDHTFQGTNIYIRPVANGVYAIGFALLLLSAAILFYAQINKSRGKGESAHTPPCSI